MFKQILNFISRPKVALIIGTFLPILLSVRVGIEAWKFPDAGLMIEQAKAINQGSTFMIANADQVKFPFGFPLIIALGFKIFETDSIVFAKVFLLTFHLGTLLIIYRILKTLQIHPKIQFLIILGYAFDPFVLSQTIDLQSEPITAFFVSWWFLLAIIELDSRIKKVIIPMTFYFSGFLAIITRPNLILPFFGIAIFLTLKWKQDHVSRNSLTIGISSFTFILSLYHIFLYKIFRAFVILAPNGPINFALGCRKEFVPQYLGIATKSQNIEINKWYTAYLQDLISGVGKNGLSFDYQKTSEAFTKAGISNCTENPLDTIWVLLLKLVGIWRPFTVFGAYDLKIFLFSIIFWIPLTFVTVQFLLKKSSDKNLQNIRLFLFIFWGLFTISMLPSSTQIRHRIPVAEQFYWIILAIYLNNRFIRKNN
jgi:hypothetical protein